MDSRVRHGNDWKKTPPSLLSLVPLPRSPASPYIHPAARISSPTTGRHRGLPLQTTPPSSLVSCHSPLVTRLLSLVSCHSSLVPRHLSYRNLSGFACSNAWTCNLDAARISSSVRSDSTILRKRDVPASLSRKSPLEWRSRSSG